MPTITPPSLNPKHPIPTPFLGIYEHLSGGYQIRNLRTGTMLPAIFPSLQEAMAAQKELDDGAMISSAQPKTLENIRVFLLRELHAWDALIAGVATYVG